MKFIDKSGRKRNGIEQICKGCGESFVTRQDQPAKFCGRECLLNNKKSRVKVDCSWCKKEFDLPKSKANSKSGCLFCSRKCKDVAQKLGGLVAIMPSHYGTGKGKYTYRSLFEERELYCRRCGYDEFVSCVDIHHLDGDRNNNVKSNLLPLCRCCHQALHLNLWGVGVMDSIRAF